MTTTTEERIADAVRAVAIALDDAVERRRSAKIDAHDLMEALLAIADALDPPLGEPKTE